VEPALQVEWYPTYADAQHAYDTYTTSGGFQKKWLYAPDALGRTNLPQIRPGDRPCGPRDGCRYPLMMTASGIAHFFSRRGIDLVDNLACHSAQLAPSFDALSYFGHAATACSGFEAHDDKLLFDRLAGHAGVAARPTTAAFALQQFMDPYFRIAAGAQPVVLSPAVSSVSPADGALVGANTATPVEVAFDARMDTSHPTAVITVSGCGAKLENATWVQGSRLSADLVIPISPPSATVTLTIAKDRAQAVPAKAPNDLLDGNQDPMGTSGQEPNGDDYVWTLSCSSAITLKDGCALLSSSEAEGYLTTPNADPHPTAPQGVAGQAWPFQSTGPGWVYQCGWVGMKAAVDPVKYCFWGGGAAPPQYTLFVQTTMAPSREAAIAALTQNPQQYQLQEAVSLEGQRYADLTVEKAVYLWRAPQPPPICLPPPGRTTEVSAGTGSQGGLLLSLSGPALQGARVIFEFDLGTQDVLALTSSSEVEAALQGMAVRLIPRSRA
jgi:hypothetical protein